MWPLLSMEGGLHHTTMLAGELTGLGRYCAFAADSEMKSLVTNCEGFADNKDVVRNVWADGLHFYPECMATS